MNVYVCSDWHLGHRKLAELGYRPGNFEDLILERHRDPSMASGDVLLNLGDVYLYPAGEQKARSLLEWYRQRGISTILVEGNHDSSRFSRAMKLGWSWACQRTTIEYGGRRILFTHAPETEFDEDLNVHGHLHTADGHRGGLMRDGRHALISMELLDYRPVKLEELVRLAETPVWSGGRFIKESAHGSRAVDSVGDAEKAEAEV